MQYSRPTLAFKPLIPLLPTSYCLPLHPHLRLMLLAASPHLLLPLSPMTPLGFFNGMLGVSKPGALNFYTFFRLILLTLFVSRNLTLMQLPLSGSLDSRTHFRSGIPSPDATHASSGVIIFARPSLSVLTFYLLFFRLTPTLIRQDILRYLFILGELNCHHSLWDSKGTSDPVGRKYSIGSSLLTSFPSLTLTYPLFSIASSLTSPLLPPLLLSPTSGGASGPGF